MGWVYFCLLAWASSLFLVPIKSWKLLWPVGVFGMTANFFIDNTLSSLNAFRFNHQLITVGNLPLAYWLAYFPGAILFAYYRPKKDSLAIAYIFLSALLLLAAELIFVYFGYFRYIHWNAASSLILNLFGFIIMSWFSELWENNGIRGIL